MKTEPSYSGSNDRRQGDRRKSDRRNVLLGQSIQASLKNYFRDLDGHDAGNLYEMILREVEKPLLEFILKQTNGNITQAAETLGLNRGTLRKKLQKYGIGGK